MRGLKIMINSNYFWIICQRETFPFTLFIMDYDFRIDQETLRIPSTAYKPVKRCQYCQSVFLNEKLCESCGRSLQHHPIGEPFGGKSLYGIKERYIESLNPILHFFPFLENKKSPMAKSYVRKLEKRFSDLVSGFNSLDLMAINQRKLFYVESMELIDELLRYGFHPSLLQALLLENDSSLVGQELMFYLQGMSTETIKTKADKAWSLLFLEYRLWGILRIEYLLKVFIITATVLSMAVKYKDIISSQFGR